MVPIYSMAMSERDEVHQGKPPSAARSQTGRAASPRQGAAPIQPRRVLFLDDDPLRAELFLRRHPEAIWVKTVAECLLRLTETWDEVYLDHDLGGKIYVDTAQSDCGMEVIRWLSREPRPHLRQTSFVIHTHNAPAGLLMVVQMHAGGFKAEFRPFGLDLVRLPSGDEAGSAQDAEAASPPARKQARWLELLRSFWPFHGQPGPKQPEGR
jgi:hypothetical protein